MKITEITEERLYFDNGAYLSYDHYQDCCEWNYADFKQIEEEAYNFDFPEDLDFEVVEGVGFRFGKKGVRMFFIPCYSVQSGYYSTEISIIYKHPLIESVFSLNCEEIS